MYAASTRSMASPLHQPPYKLQDVSGASEVGMAWYICMAFVVLKILRDWGFLALCLWRISWFFVFQQVEFQVRPIVTLQRSKTSVTPSTTAALHYRSSTLQVEFFFAWFADGDCEDQLDLLWWWWWMRWQIFSFPMSPRDWTYCTFSDIYQDCTKKFVPGCWSVIQHSAPVPPLHQQVNIVAIFSCFCKL